MTNARILVVDDEPQIRRVMRVTLTEKGYAITDARSAVTQLQYDGNGNLTQLSAPLGVQAKFTYDNFGDRLTFTDGLGNTWSYAYDASGNPVVDASGNVQPLPRLAKVARKEDHAV